MMKSKEQYHTCLLIQNTSNMINPRATVAVVATLAGSAYAWTSRIPTAAATSGTLRLIAQRATTSTTLRMNFFSSLLFGGGAFDLKIDYTKLDFPGDELGEFAKAGQVPVVSTKRPDLHLATFAGGCFWGLELAYQRIPGVEYTAVGYTQGSEQFPNYDQVCAGATGHTEAVLVYYDPTKCHYEDLLDAFFERVDPRTVNGQGRDYGRQYRTGIYFHTREQEAVARKRFEFEQQKDKKPIATDLKAAMPFWPAEQYHQQYLQKGGRFGLRQDASKGATASIRCYG
jgi:peptide-methionine (S)-S-oxide reductase